MPRSAFCVLAAGLVATPSSPAIAMGGDTIFRDEERYAKQHKDLPVSIYMGAGELETFDLDTEALGRVVSGISHLSGMLSSRHYPNLKLVIEIHAGMGHGDVIGATIPRGLRTLFPMR